METAFVSAFALELITTLSIALIAVSLGFRLIGGEIAFAPAFFALLLAPDRSVASTIPAAATALFANQNVVVGADNTASLPVRRYPAIAFLPRQVNSRPPSSHADANAAVAQDLRVIVITPDTGEEKRPAAHRGHVADALRNAGPDIQ